MELSFRDYFCNFCGALLCYSSSKFFAKNSNLNYHHSSSSNMNLRCYQCKQSFNKSLQSISFIPLRQILKAEIIRDSDLWSSASITNEKCPKCTHDRAYYLQMQTRSADEPMTTYYRCEKCAHNWKD